LKIIIVKRNLKRYKKKERRCN